MSDIAEIKTDVLLAAKRLGIEPSKVAFSHKLEWIERDGRLVLNRAAVDRNSKKITLFVDALQAKYPLSFRERLLKTVSECSTLTRDWDESEHPRDEDGKFSSGGGGGDGGESEAVAGGDAVKHTSVKLDGDEVSPDVVKHTISIGASTATVYEHPDSILLDQLKTPESARGQGLAGKAVEYVKAHAEKSQKILFLVSQPKDDKTDQKKLTAFYEKHGFTKAKGEGKNAPVMYYNPPSVTEPFKGKFSQYGDEFWNRLFHVPDKFSERDWDESEHPRDDNGRFTFGAGDDDDEGGSFQSPADAYSKATQSDHVGIGSGFDLRPGKPMPSQSIIVTVNRGHSEKAPSYHDYEVLINPTMSEAKMISMGEGARVLQDRAGNIFVWQAYNAVHAQMMDALAPVETMWASDEWAVVDGRIVSDTASGTEKAREWITLGQQNAKGADEASVGFVSPNVKTDLDFDGAVKELKSEQQASLLAASTAIDRALGLKAKEASIVGAWTDGAENSIMMTAGSDWDHAVLATVMKGHLANQKSVLVFQQQAGGDAVLASFRATGTLADIHKTLVEAGLVSHTLVPSQGGATVYVADLDGSLADAVEKASERYDATVTIRHGRGDYIGDNSGKGSDAEQRERARGIFEKIINESQIQNSKGIWSNIRYKWSKTTSEEKVAASFVATEAARIESIVVRERLAPGRVTIKQLLDRVDTREWDESEHPRDEDGKFSSGGGGDEEIGGAESSQDDSGGSFSESEVKIFKEYTATEGSNKLNKFYRAADKSKYSEKTRKELTAKIDTINAALKKTKISSDATLYRAVAPCRVATELNQDHNAEKLVGQKMPLGGFQSTATKWDAAVGYAEKSGANIIMIMDVPAKTPAIDMTPFSKYKESEMLLGPGDFTVTGVKREEGDYGGAVIMIFGKYSAGGALTNA